MSRPLLDLNDEDLMRADNLAALETRGNVAPPAPLSDVDAMLSEQGFYEDQDARGSVGQPDPDFGIKQLGAYLMDLRKNCIAQRWGLDENTMLNLAFLAGHHYVEADRSRRAVVEIPAPRDMIRRCFNRYVPWYNAQHGKLSGGVPDYFIRPKKKTQLDRDAARFADELAEWMVPVLFSHPNRSTLAHWKLMAGNFIAYIGVEWAEDAGYLPELATPDAALNRPDLVFEIFPPHQTWCDLRMPTIKEMHWFGIDRIMRVADARAEYPDLTQELFPEGVTMEHAVHIRNRAGNLLGTPDAFGDSRTLTPAGLHATALEGEDDVVVPEFWGRKGMVLQFLGADQLDPSLVPFEVIPTESGDPLVRFPEGLRVCFSIWGTVLDYGKNIHDHLPFREGKYSKASGVFGPAPATAGRQVHQALNWVENLRESGIELSGNPKILQPDEARVSRRSLISGVKQMVRYKANRFNAKPEYMTPPTSIPDMAVFEKRLDEVWMDIMGRHEVSQARLPAADTSGIAISLLQEQDLTQLGYSGEDEEEAFLDILRMAMVSVQRFFPAQDPRLIALAGDTPYLLEAFMSADLAHGLDLQVVQGSAIPRSPAQMQAMVEKAWQLGTLLDKYGRPDYKKVNDVLGFGSSDDLFDGEIDEQNARDEEEFIINMPPQELVMIFAQVGATGQLPEFLFPGPEDDHIVHEHSHRARIKVLKRDPRVLPIHICLLRAHWALHVQVIGPVLQQLDPEVMLGAAIPATAGLIGAGAQQQEQGGEQEQGGKPAPMSGAQAA